MMPTVRSMVRDLAHPVLRAPGVPPRCRGEIHAYHVDTGCNHARQYFAFAGCRAEGGYDFCSLHSVFTTKKFKIQDSPRRHCVVNFSFAFAHYC
jgi:hypothetical protein